MRDSATGLILEKTVGAEQFKLEFSAGIIMASSPIGVEVYAYGIRNPTDGYWLSRDQDLFGWYRRFLLRDPDHRWASCLWVRAEVQSSLATDNYFAKVDLRDM